MVIQLKIKKGESGIRSISIESYPEPFRAFARTAIETLIKVEGAKSSIIGPYHYALRTFLRWLLEESKLAVAEKLANGELITEKEWKLALSGFKDAQLGSELRDKTVKSRLLAINALFKKLSIRGVVSKFKGSPVKIPRNITNAQSDKNFTGDKSHKIPRHLKRALISMADVKETEVNPIIDIFQNAESACAKDEQSRTKVINAVVKLIESDLQKLRDTAEEIYTECKDKINYGRRINKPKALSDELVGLANEHGYLCTKKDGATYYTAYRQIEKAFQTNFDKSQFQHALLSYVEHYAEGLWPRTDNVVGGAISERIFGFVGADEIHELLHPSARFIASNIILLALQTALNHDSIYGLKEEALEYDAQGRAKAIRYYKGRSDKKMDGKEESKPLRGFRKGYRYTPAEIIEKYLSISERYRQYTESEYLFVAVPRQSESVVNARTKGPELYSRSAIKRAAKVIFEEAGVDFIGVDDIRKRVLLLTALKSGTFAAIVEADHRSMGSIRHYIDADITTYQSEGKLKAFQSAYELAIQKNAKAFLTAIGVPEEQHDAAIAKMSDSGLGTLCMDKKFNPVTKEKSDKDCDAFENCMSCEQFKPIVILEPNNIARLITFHEHLKASENQCRLHSETVWRTKWQPWLFFTSAVMDILNTPVHMRVKKDAMKICQSNRPMMPELW